MNTNHVDTILLVEDDYELRDTINDILISSGYNVVAVDNAKEALINVQNTENNFCLVLSDIQMPGHDGLWLANKVVPFDIPIILMTAFASVDKAVESMKIGICDFITKPFNKKDLILSIESFKRSSHPNDVICEDDSSIKIYNEIKAVSKHPVPILLTGESGVGKDVIANQIHGISGRTGAFIAVNCSSIPKDMLEAVLFGYEKGAFTGAVKKHDGKFIQSDKGTLFLDEIGEMPLDLQTKLLRVLETGEVDIIGGTTKKIDLNIISATNANLDSLIKDKLFRLDLLYRINVISFKINPLRNRPKDLQALILYFIDYFSNKYGKKMTIHNDSMLKLTSYNWPGNIRELKNVINRSVILSDEMIMESSIVLHSEESLEDALNKHGGNRKDTAEYLGISVRTLQYKIKDEGLKLK